MSGILLAVALGVRLCEGHFCILTVVPFLTSSVLAERPGDRAAVTLSAGEEDASKDLESSHKFQPFPPGADSDTSVKAQNLSALSPPPEQQQQLLPQNDAVLPCDTPMNTAEIDASKHMCPRSPTTVGADSCQYMSIVSKCKFRCVRSQDCGQDEVQAKVKITHHVASQVSEDGAYMCRKCQASGCDSCITGTDTCKVCMDGFELVDGLCVEIQWECNRTHCQPAWYLLYVFSGSLVLGICIWYFDLVCRKKSNLKVLEQALKQRDSAKLQSYDRVQGVSSHPLSTNLCRVAPKDNLPIGGPTSLLHFNFQVAVLIWSVFAAVGWVLTASLTSWDLFNIGPDIKVATSMFSLCKLEHEMPSRYLTVQAGRQAYLLGLYIFTTVGSLAFAVFQALRFRELDQGVALMRDYAMVLFGFPKDDSGPGVEADRKKFIEGLLGGKEIVGVSVCWDYFAVSDKITSLMDNEVENAKLKMRKDTTTAEMVGVHSHRAEKRVRCSCLGGIFEKLDDGLFQTTGATLIDKGPLADMSQEDIEEMVRGIKPTSILYAVFHTEKDRDDALTELKQTKIYYDDHHHIRVGGKEGFFGFCHSSSPESVDWKNFSLTLPEKKRRLIISCVIILAAVALWMSCIFAPYGFYVKSSYDRYGTPPSRADVGVFMLLVVLGNATLYQICWSCANWVGFPYNGYTQGIYLIFYTCAMLTNLAADLVVMWYTSRAAIGVMSGDDAIKEMTAYDSIQNSANVEAFLGDQLFLYNVPSCFHLPFIFEAFITVVLPYHLGVMLVGLYPVNQQNAAQCLAPIEFDLGRYADIIINLVQATVSLAFSPGYVLKTFLGLMAGHIFIYVWDHCRVLRYTKAYHFSQSWPELVAERLLVLPCAVIACCFCRVYFQEETGYHLMAVFIGHCCIHLYVMVRLVPFFAKSTKAERALNEVPYEKAAQEATANWFNANPLHCLRSKYIHKNAMPCSYYLAGHRRNRRLRMDKMAKDNSEGIDPFAPLFKSKLFKLSSGGNMNEPKNWLERDMWVTVNGDLCYWSAKEKADLVIYTADDILKSNVVVVSNKENGGACREHIFQIEPPAMDGGARMAPGVFSSETDEQLQDWIEALGKSVDVD